MVYITEQLIRNRAEHNNCELSTLEEVSLHQLDIEKIEYIDNWCRHLKILYLQSNLIGRIENVSKLKKLEYLNLALNNILKIENLEGCESLEKLDLTVNFIGELSSLSRLSKNEFLKELYLTGNPCTDFVGYRDYVIASLPHLSQLDGVDISKSERIKAIQKFEEIKCEIMRQEKKYFQKLEKERLIKEQENKEKEETGDIDDEEKDDDFWNQKTKYTPETRLEIHRHLEKERKNNEKQKSKFADPEPYQRVIRYFNDEGRPFNINQANIPFELKDEISEIVLDLACYKHLDTSLIDVDVQPNYVRVLLKGKVFQIALNEEVSPDSSNAQRSQVTGHLVITMKKLKSKLSNNIYKAPNIAKTKPDIIPKVIENCQEKQSHFEKRHEKLEVDSSVKKTVDFQNIINESVKLPAKLNKKAGNEVANEVQRKAKDDFIDDPDVPPLL